MKFPIADVLSVTSRLSLSDGGSMVGVFKVMDFLLNEPHMSTIGYIMMQPDCANMIHAQHPELEPVTDALVLMKEADNIESMFDIVRKARVAYGDEIELEVPIAA